MQVPVRKCIRRGMCQSPRFLQRERRKKRGSAESVATLIKRLKVSEVPSLVKEGIIKGGMIPKVNCCVECVRQGVERANIQDGRVPHSILIELLTNEGVGTMFS